MVVGSYNIDNLLNLISNRGPQIIRWFMIINNVNIMQALQSVTLIAKTTNGTSYGTKINSYLYFILLF